MGDRFVRDLRKLLSESRGIPLTNIKQRKIGPFLNKLKNIYWRPDYLLKDTNHKKYLAFTTIYAAESFPGILAEEVEKAIQMCAFDHFFILEDESLLDIFEENCREKGFGVILHRVGDPLIIRDAIKPVSPGRGPSQYVGHFPTWVVTELRKIDLGNSKFRTALQDFSDEYLKLKRRAGLDWQREEQLIKNTIAELLKSDSRYTFGVDSLEILGRFESFWVDIRDHYFHSFHIFLLGLLILNQYREEFVNCYKTIFPRYRNHSLEFLWLLTSIFHDVGYPIAKLNNLKEDIYGVSSIPYEKEITDVWNDPIYKENLKQLTSLFKFSLSAKKHKSNWHPEVFGFRDEELDRIFRKSFYNCHGTAGCFRFLVEIFSEARREEDTDKRIFLINHIYPAGLSIALHDRMFREKLRNIGIKQIRFSRFPFAVLLVYLDSLQEDRRDKFLCIESPDILQGFEYNGKVTARINESVARDYPRLGKLKAECRDFLDFMDCDGIKFEYPKVLLV